MSEVARFIRNPIANIISLAICCAALAYAYNANTNQLEESKRRTEQIEVQNRAIEAQNRAIADQAQRQRNGLCGLQFYLSVPASPNPTPPSAAFRDVVSALTGPQSLDCTPDPNDGK